MTAPSHPALAGQPVSRRRLRRLSRRFARVGVEVSASRLADIAAGRSVSEAELVDVEFASAVTQIQGEQRRAKRVRAQRRCVHWAIVAGSVVIALNVLLCLGLVVFMLAAHISPW